MHNGRVTIPKDIRGVLGLKQDDLVELDINRPKKKERVKFAGDCKGGAGELC
jgi:bifunctional DNA-binding transcriptional regulator/antitoxin component of YhaV-PrlF toxin-antitoxin module